MEHWVRVPFIDMHTNKNTHLSMSVSVWRAMRDLPVCCAYGVLRMLCMLGHAADRMSTGHSLGRSGPFGFESLCLYARK